MTAILPHARIKYQAIAKTVSGASGWAALQLPRRICIYWERQGEISIGIVLVLILSVILIR